ncbi:MAG: hypothetical protein FJY91_02905 [Candidatus Harrisonbacteria bacterium]|nr:hypothetical protein [Candidatus Harrisonbacteria bacterium]
MSPPSIDIIILAAGRGTRMSDQSLPKVLHPLAGKPLISHLLETIHSLSIPAHTIIVVGYKSEKVKTACGPTYTYALQKEQLGTGHATLSAIPFIKSDHILVLYGDMPMVSKDSLEKIVNLHLSTTPAITLFTTITPHFDPPYSAFLRYGRILRDQETKNFLKITEAKDATEDELKIHEVNPGIYLFSRSFLEKALPSLTSDNTQHELYLTDCLAVACKKNLPILSLPLPPAESLGVNSDIDLKILLSLSTLEKNN